MAMNANAKIPPTLFVMVGLPGSGKTAWARRAVDDGGGRCKRVSKEELRGMLDNGRYSEEAEEMVLTIRDYAVATVLDAGMDVVVDDTNLAPKHQSRLLRLAAAHNASGKVIDLTSVPVETCIARDAGRGKPVGEKVIRDMYDQFVAPKGCRTVDGGRR